MTTTASRERLPALGVTAATARMRARGGVAAVAAVGVVLAMGAPTANAETTIGQTPPTFNNGFVCANVSVLQRAVAGPPGYTVPPGSWILTSWSHRASSDANQTLTLRVYRPVGDLATATNFSVVGQDGPRPLVAEQLNTFSVTPGFAVEEGDVLGLRVPPGPAFRQCFFATPDAGDVQGFSATGSDAPGTEVFDTNQPNRRLNVSAVLEPDCDRDGLGDETQDNNLNSCPPGPSATITGAPADKVKTRRKRKNVTFTFSASEPGAIFNCVLDGRQEFKACTSPLTVSVKKGEHSFSVQATDAGGNQGVAATDTFKVKRKRKRK